MSLPSKPTRKKCAFCQRDDQKISNEHAWPNWILSCLPNPQITVEFHRNEKLVGQWRPKDSTGVTVNDFCKPCNEGWMHDIEEAVRPFLGPLITAPSDATLTPQQLTILATWVYKTVLVFDLVSVPTSRLFSTPDYTSFYERKLLPVGGVIIWYAAYVGTMQATATSQSLVFNELLGPRTLAATLSAGRFAFQLLRYETNRLPPPGIWIPESPPPWCERLRLGWPIMGSPYRPFAFRWPPRDILDDAAMIDLRRRWSVPGDVRGLLVR